MITDSRKLLHMYPTMVMPIRCENGCGVIIELMDSFESYKHSDDGQRLLICECCAAEEGHANEDLEDDHVGPVCRRKEKR